MADTRKIRPLLTYATALPLGALLAACLLAGCSSKDALVKPAKAEIQSITRTVSANGRVELLQDFQAHAASTAQVKEIFVKVGQQVEAGQLLMRLDDTDARLRIQNAGLSISTAQNSLANMNAGGTAEELLSAQSDMTTSQLQLRQAQDRLSSLQMLQTRGAASSNEVTGAQNQVTQAQNRIDALKARQTGRFNSGDKALQREQIARSRAELSAAQSGLAQADIRAPFAGTVYALPVMPFANVGVEADLVNVADLNKIRVRAYFDEPEIGRLAVGQAVRITWEARPEHTWHGHISQLPTSITNYGTRNVGECLITVDDARADLIPNVNVTVYVTTLHRDGVLAIPREALRTDGTSNYVYKIVNDKLQRTPVRVDVITQTQVQITSGLQPGDAIVQVPMNDVELRDGVPVKVQP